MKFEKLNESNGKSRKMFLCGLIVGVGLLIIFNLFLTKAKYKVVDSAKLVESNINYKIPDLNVIAMYKKDKGKSEFESIEEIPTGTYVLSNESYCAVKGQEQIKNNIKYENGKLNVDITKKGTKCYIYFEEKTLSEQTLDKLNLTLSSDSSCPTINSDGSAEITEIEDSKSLLCKGVDDYGTTYYFRGIGTHNWLKIDNTYWRIIRINGNGTIRLIYNGSGTSDSDTGIVSSKAYNTTRTDNAYVGFMYGSTGANAYATTHTNTNPSNILGELKTWWTGSDFPEVYKKYVDGATGFCNDRTSYTGTTNDTKSTTNAGFGNKTTYYGSYIRVITDKKPSFKCPQKEQDLFTTNDNEKGNKALSNVDGETVPVGLITADEVMYAGGVSGPYNTSYYLYNGQFYWTMSPYYYYNSSSEQHADVFRVFNNGHLGYDYVSNDIPGVRPVINLKADTPFTIDGNGTSSNPFTVKLD